MDRFPLRLGLLHMAYSAQFVLSWLSAVPLAPNPRVLPRLLQVLEVVLTKLPGSPRGPQDTNPLYLLDHRTLLRHDRHHLPEMPLGFGQQIVGQSRACTSTWRMARVYRQLFKGSECEELG